MEGEKEKYFFMYMWVFVLPILLAAVLTLIISVVTDPGQAYVYISNAGIFSGVSVMFFYPFYTLLSANFYVFLTDGKVEINEEESRKDKKFIFGVLIISLLLCIAINVVPAMNLFYIILR